MPGHSHAALIARSLTVLAAGAVLVAAQTPAQAAADVLWNDAWTGGAFLRGGVTLYTHDPEFILCKPDGCAPADVSDRAGQAVGIECRRDPEGYLKLYYASDQDPAWASENDVRVKGAVRACDWWEW